MQQSELQKAIERLNRAIDDMNQQNTWEFFQQVCQYLSAIIPGFVCPFSGVPGIPSLDEMAPYAQQWTLQYAEAEPPPTE